MGKTRGHGSRRGAYKGRGKGRGEEDEESSEEEYEQPRGLGGQASTVGMLPPSDSDSDDGEEKAEKKEEKKEGEKEGEKEEKKEKKKEKKEKKSAQSKNAGKLPPSGSEDEEEDSSEEEDSGSDSDSDGAPAPAYLTQAAPRKKKTDDELDPETIRRDMERLQMIKERREQDRLKRIADEGWDRFAPVSETNKPPGHVPSDHPAHKEE
ncbi:hypothetical protein Rsub_13061 [Raphidocelis subcapitata]|uniref:Uncharacterized protein n=1 Tax=Raphidocelis subcapitata TaxID=307507 RepID=A0A2V0PKR2_9CHLO|nr:hypothetical protein Rsub_13061 [Raphidocelis subcapitata]|eukprot:GBG00379.1 hypothetical protein Rsub_13061 [Raphidocelis subcapitata]